MKTQPIRDKNTVTNCLMYLEKRSKRNALMFAIAIYTGLRIGDILTLKISSVRNKEQIIVKQQKTKQYIYIPMNKELKKMVDEDTRGKPHNEYLIKSRQGYNKPITRSMAHKILKDMAYDLGLENISCHSLRKTFGRQVYNMNNENSELALVKLMELFNHSSVAITKRYLGLKQEEILQTYDCLSF